MGRELFIGEKRVYIEGHGNLAMSPKGIIYTGMRDGLAALNMKGKVLWTTDAKGTSPVLDGKGCVFFMDEKGTVHALDKNGKTLWRWDMPKPDRYFSSLGFNGLSIGTDSTLFVSYDHTLFAIG